MIDHPYDVRMRADLHWMKRSVEMSELDRPYPRDQTYTTPEENIHVRMLLRVSIPVESGNAAAKSGTLGSTVERILADLKPEAAYFFVDDNGNRAGAMIFDMKDSSELPAVAEPWFLAFGAKVSFRPVMNPQDLAKAGPSISSAVKQYLG
jgi:hypothetical protein